MGSCKYRLIRNPHRFLIIFPCKIAFMVYPHMLKQSYLKPSTSCRVGFPQWQFHPSLAVLLEVLPGTVKAAAMPSPWQHMSTPRWEISPFKAYIILPVAKYILVPQIASIIKEVVAVSVLACRRFFLWHWSSTNSTFHLPCFWPSATWTPKLKDPS